MRMERHSFLSLGSRGFHRVAYTEWGDAANPHVVLCVHGLARNSRDFDFLAEALARDARVVCMDVVGRGDSDWLDDKSEYTFSTYMSDAAALIARVTTPVRERFFPDLRARWLRRTSGTRLDWVGTSMGGLIGMLLAAKRNAPIRRLVLNDVGPLVPWHALFRLKGHIGRANRFASMEEVEAHVRQACASFGPLTDAQWRHLAVHSVREQEDGSLALRYDPGIGRAFHGHRDPELPPGPDFLRGVDLWHAWEQVRCPQLVLRGETSEVLTRDTLADMQRRNPRVEAVEFPGVGHAPALMSDEQVGVVREFLTRAEAPAVADLDAPGERQGNQ
jgi:pimeloyl-ACP methyl ester carboxylesterase